MKIKKVIKDLDIEIVKGSKELEITGISLDSRVVSPGNLFIALKGEKFDGNEFIQDALKAGAICILSDIYNPFLEGVAQLVTKDVKRILPALAKNFYQDPSSKLFTVGITGTNGKTTSSYLIKHLLDIKGDTGLIGTIERIIGKYKMPSSLTTPDCITTNKLLREMLEEGLHHAVMEVSSHALDQERALGIMFDHVLFTNISPEHLDYHKDMEDYIRAKSKLFSPLYMKKGSTAFVNRDDPNTRAIIKGCKERVITFGVKDSADYQAKDISYEMGKTSFTLVTEESMIKMRVSLVGEYNLYNVLGAIAIAHQCEIPLELIKKRLLTFPQVRGRLEKVKNPLGRHIFVDFAHKYEALNNVLQTLSRLKEGKLITLFGCGGNRDPYKRPKMAEIAEKYSDFVIVTSDNPRSEPPEKIIQEIVVGFKGNAYAICADRYEAIKQAIKRLKENDILLIAGRGHESEQIHQFQSIDFDDVKVAEEIANVLT